MIHLVPLSLGLIVLLAMGSRPDDEPTQPLRVFADLDHTGKLSGPLTSRALNPDEFAIAVPLPGRSTDRRVRENVERLGRLRLEAVKGAGELVLSADATTSRHLRLFRRGKSEWRRVAPGKDQS